MLTQRTLYRNWQKQTLPTMFSLRCYSPNLLLHHTRTRLQALTLRSLRTSRSHLNPPRTPTTIQATPFEGLAYGSGSVPPGSVVKALVFTGAFSTGCFLGATVMEYENARNMMLEKARQHKFPWLKRKEKQGSITESPGYWQNLKYEVDQLWNQLTPGEKVFAPLCALNLLVFALWRVPRLKNTMMTYFCSNPAGRAVCWPMFLSTFSHYSTFHIFANMYVLHSFSNAAVLSLGKEQFLAVYLSAGVIASLSSILYKAVTTQAGLSLGASGAIMAILAFVCAQYPDTQLSILFLPMLTFSAGAAIKVIMGIDLAGCLLGWKFFDHAAHLGGALFGIFWAFYGSDVWQRRIRFLSMYHDWRKTK